MNNDLLNNLDKLIKNKKEFLIYKYNDIKNKYKNNKFLKPVVDDYNNHNNSVANDKKKVLDALYNIQSHLDNLVLNNSSNQELLSQLNKELSDISLLISSFKS
jgi:hypothetical protein